MQTKILTAYTSVRLACIVSYIGLLHIYIFTVFTVQCLLCVCLRPGLQLAQGLLILLGLPLVL